MSTRESPQASILVYLLVQNRLLREALVRLFNKRSGFCVLGKNRQNDTELETCLASHSPVLLLDSLTPLLTPPYSEEPFHSSLKGRVVLFGMDDDREAFFDAVRLGVVGYLLNDASSEDIASAVRGVASGEAVCPPKLCMALFDFASRELNKPTNAAPETNGSIKNGLTMRQRQLMALVAKGMTNKEIAANLSLSEFTVKNHIHRVLKHVEVENRHEAVDVMRENGLLPVS
jgi:DNA-binding NarL/FixJ family response regulator